MKEILELMYAQASKGLLEEPYLKILISKEILGDIKYNKETGYVTDFNSIPVYVELDSEELTAIFSSV